MFGKTMQGYCSCFILATAVQVSAVIFKVLIYFKRSFFEVPFFIRLFVAAATIFLFSNELPALKTSSIIVTSSAPSLM